MCVLSRPYASCKNILRREYEVKQNSYVAATKILNHLKKKFDVVPVAFSENAPPVEFITHGKFALLTKTISYRRKCYFI